MGVDVRYRNHSPTHLDLFTVMIVVRVRQKKIPGWFGKSRRTGRQNE